MVNNLDEAYWNNRYLQEAIGWDLGEVSPPLKVYIDQLEDKNLKILIPGCGSGYEGKYLHDSGFSNVHLLDFASEPLELFKLRNKDFPLQHLHKENFFEHQGNYDLILEQTLFCAIDPSRRGDYAKKASSLLNTGGKLVGLLFNRDFEGGPPFGGSEQEYLDYFKPFFSSIQMNECYNSIKPRLGSELFIHLIK